MRKKMILAAAAVLGLAAAGGLAWAQEHEGEAGHNAAEPTHFPIFHPKYEKWTFAGPLGRFDKGQLQRGYKVYREVCSACHSMNYVPFRALSALGYSEGQIKTVAAEAEVQDGPNADGEMFTRAGIPSDYFVPPYPNPEAAAAANNGAAPPDLSLIAKARAVERGFPNFVIDLFTQYQEMGPDYIHSLLTGYGQEPPEGMTVPEGTYYNPYFIAGKALAMPPPLSDGQVEYDDGMPQTTDQYARDVAAFLMWAAEPHLEERKLMGFRVLIFLLVFTGLVWIVKRRIWADVPH